MRSIPDNSPINPVKLAKPKKFVRNEKGFLQMAGGDRGDEPSGGNKKKGKIRIVWEKP